MNSLVVWSVSSWSLKHTVQYHFTVFNWCCLPVTYVSCGHLSNLKLGHRVWSASIYTDVTYEKGYLKLCCSENSAMDDHLALCTKERFMRENWNGIEGILWKDFNKLQAPILLPFTNKDDAQGIPRRPLLWPYGVPTMRVIYLWQSRNFKWAVCVHIIWTVKYRSCGGSNSNWLRNGIRGVDNSNVWNK